MKKYILVGLVVVAVCAAGYYLVKNGNSNKDSDSVANSMVRDFAAKYNKPADTFNVKVETNTGEFAKGTVNFTDESGGGLWFAAKTDNGWELAFDGNGIIPCIAANKYNFPSDMVPKCVDDLTGNLISRQVVSLDQKNCTYTIDGKSVTLKDGYAEETVSGASKLVTKYFGNEISGDLNNDGFSDVAFLLTQDSGGSGTFYYVVAALGGADGCKGTNAILLGDRIAPQTTELNNGQIIVNYADRNQGEPMTAQPSVGVSRYLTVNDDQLVEVK